MKKVKIYHYHNETKSKVLEKWLDINTSNFEIYDLNELKEEGFRKLFSSYQLELFDYIGTETTVEIKQRAQFNRMTVNEFIETITLDPSILITPIVAFERDDVLVGGDFLEVEKFILSHQK